MRVRDKEGTRRRLVEAGLRLFTDPGFAAASTVRLVEEAGVTRGALYHHFPTKEALFAEVVERLQDDIAGTVRAAVPPGTSGLAALQAGFAAYLDCCLRPDIRRIVLLDGPAVLGWARWHQIDQRHAFGLTRTAVASAVAGGELRASGSRGAAHDGAELDVDALTHVLLGAVTQASLELGRAQDPQTARRTLGVAVDALLDGLC